MAADFHDLGSIMFQSFEMLMAIEAADFRSMKALYWVWKTLADAGHKVHGVRILDIIVRNMY